VACNQNIAQKKAKLTAEQVVKIRRYYRDFYGTAPGVVKHLAATYKVSPGCISNLVSGRSYTWIPDDTTHTENPHYAEESIDRSAAADAGND
jgi:hypothetical protein